MEEKSQNGQRHFETEGDRMQSETHLIHGHTTGHPSRQIQRRQNSQSFLIYPEANIGFCGGNAKFEFPAKSLLELINERCAPFFKLSG